MSHVRECQQCGETYVPANGSCPTCEVETEDRAYGVWCVRHGGRAGFAEAWLKVNDKRAVFPTEDAARAEAARLMAKIKTTNVSYSAREIY